jgi:hypothetical protein
LSQSTWQRLFNGHVLSRHDLHVFLVFAVLRRERSNTNPYPLLVPIAEIVAQQLDDSVEIARYKLEPPAAIKR